nr:hypothetical protein [Streptomyces aureocirculatus]
MDADCLLPRVARGDQKVFEKLYGLVSGPVYGLAHRVLPGARHLSVPLGTVKTQPRDGLLRLRDCPGAAA